MQIRSITFGIEASVGDPSAAAREGGEFLRAARDAFAAAGLLPQSTRLATQPVHLFLAPADLLPFGRALDAACVKAEIDYYATGAIALGGAWTADATAEAVASAIIGTDRLFTSIQLLRREGAALTPPSPAAAGEGVTPSPYPLPRHREGTRQATPSPPPSPRGRVGRQHRPSKLPPPSRGRVGERGNRPHPALSTQHSALEIDYAALGAAARIIARVARETPNGFGNLRFAGAANIPPNTPFFPVAYHAGGPAAFSIALQAADLAVQAFGGADSLDAARARLVARIQEERGRIDSIAHDLERTTGVRFAGLDLSLAPFPSAEESIGTALEALGLDRLGAPGSLAAAALLTQALHAAAGQPGYALTPTLSQRERGQATPAEQTPSPLAGEGWGEGESPAALSTQHSALSTGFSGLMLPVLEDAVLAQRASDGSLSLSDLLLYSTVCGTGLDTVPLPGDLSEDAIASILLDVAALSRALRKPLTARLFPVPGKAAGDLTEFDFPFFANARVLPVRPLTAARLISRGVKNEELRVKSEVAPIASLFTLHSALLTADRLQADAAAVGFDWPDVRGVIDKLHEEVAELAAARDAAEREDELGDLMFSLVNLARWFGLSAEAALEHANDKFTRRFDQVLAACQQQGRRPQDLTLAELEALWQEAKRTERP